MQILAPSREGSEHCMDALRKRGSPPSWSLESGPKRAVQYKTNNSVLENGAVQRCTGVIAVTLRM